MIVTVVFADIGGYVAGVLFGKHLMAPAISPKKSWEGLGGSLLFGITAAVLSVTFLLDRPAWVGVPLGLMLVITGVLGDLVESQVKRDLGIKDMGTLLPGHGGIMDRIDAMLPSAVAGWIVLTLLADRSRRPVAFARMLLSCALVTNVDSPELIAEAERLGYRRAWLYDSPAITSDVWMALALAASGRRPSVSGPACSCRACATR